MSVAAGIGWLLPLAAGCALWLACAARRAPGWAWSMLGCGGVLGLLLAAAFASLFARADTADAWRLAAPWMAGFTLACALIAALRWRPRATCPRAQQPPAWLLGMLALGLLSLCWRGWIALREILLRPTFPWDAWDAWAVKSKTWFLLGHYAPFVSIGDWLMHPARELYTSVAWSYPSTLAWMQVWFASAAHGWNEPLVNLPWFALWLGLLVGHYGQWRALGVSRPRAIVAMYALGSLPLLDVHVALAGYADLWIATLLGFALACWLRWRQDRDAGQLLLAVACACCLPLLKLEGAVWLVLLALALLLGGLSRRWRWIVVACAAVVMALLVVLPRAMFPVPGLGFVRIDHGVLDVPGFGRLALAWHGAALPDIAAALLLQPNWHLLWWIAPLLVAWRWPVLRGDAALRTLGIFLLLGGAFLLILFAGTAAAQWAESYTAINRLILHIVPATITLLVMLCREAAAPAVAQCAAPPRPA